VSGGWGQGGLGVEGGCLGRGRGVCTRRARARARAHARRPRHRRPLKTPPARPPARPPAAPQILEEQQGLLFHLQQQRLIEMIRAGATSEALDFAREYLAPAGEEHPEFLEELGGWLYVLGGGVGVTSCVG
jgi:hypothetical protein